MLMLDTDMISSANFARLVYDGNGSVPGNPAGPPGAGEVERVFTDFWASQGFASEQLPFDGRSDYVGFTDRGIPAGGIFAGAEAPKTKQQVRLYGGVAGGSSTRAATWPATGCRRSSARRRSRKFKGHQLARPR